MKTSSLLSSLAILARFAYAADATDAEVAIVKQALVDVTTAVNTLDGGVKSFAGPADVPKLTGQSSDVIAALNKGTSNITPITGVLTVGQAAGQLLTPVQALGSSVDTVINDVIAQKAALVAACIGPTILDQLKQQQTAATAFRASVASKVAAENQGLVNQLSQPLLDSIARGVSSYSDQTSLPASCNTQSSAAPSVAPSTASPAPPSSAPPASASVATSAPESIAPSSTAAVTSDAVTSEAPATSSVAVTTAVISSATPAVTTSCTKGSPSAGPVGSKTVTVTVTKAGGKTTVTAVSTKTIKQTVTSVVTATKTAACQTTPTTGYNTPPSYNPPSYDPWAWLRNKWSAEKSKWSY